MLAVADWLLSYSAQKFLPWLKLPRHPLHLSIAPGWSSNPGVDVSVEEAYCTPMHSAAGYCLAHCSPSLSLLPLESLPLGQTKASSLWIQATQVYSACSISTSFRSVERYPPPLS